ncbi:MAG: NADH-quinone oxidoreductase subunit C [Phycisphaerales bacterium]|nr:MAG: NADH-quinone oxidoreductase subunit C [Phycisphaerales bacterium]
MNQQELDKKLSEIKDRLIGVEQKADNRIYLLCEAENSYAVNKFLFEDVGCRFAIVTGIDAEHCFEVLYHFSYDQLGCVITVKAFIRDREHPSIESITPFLPGAEWIEREIHDILGIEIKNHPNMKRLILAEDWPEGVYPMRKEVST